LAICRKRPAAEDIAEPSQKKRKTPKKKKSPKKKKEMTPAKKKQKQAEAALAPRVVRSLKA